MTERTYLVSTKDGEIHEIAADYAFENTQYGAPGIALVFRQGTKGNTNVVASFAPGEWSYYKLKPEGVDPIPDNEPEPSIDVEELREVKPTPRKRTRKTTEDREHEYC